VLDGGSDALLDEYSATRRPIATEVVALTDRLTKLATLPRPLRPVRNVMLAIIGRIPPATRALASRLSGLVYR
jgi:2-polyprenyl-6-methoxyphenol hydroxylase-like FAD-dependent oxidoreductase